MWYSYTKMHSLYSVYEVWRRESQDLRVNWIWSTEVSWMWWEEDIDKPERPIEHKSTAEEADRR